MNSFHSKPDQIPLDNLQHRELLKNIYVSLDNNLFSIHKIIPSLIPDHHLKGIPFDRDFHISISQLVDNLRAYSEKAAKLYPLIDHERFDKQIVIVFEELVRENKITKNEHELALFRKNILPILWTNISFVLEKYIHSFISKRQNYSSVAKSIHNLFQELFHALFQHFVTSNTSSEVKNILEKSAKYSHNNDSQDPYLCFQYDVYYDSSITHDNLVKFNFLSSKNKIPICIH